MVPDILILWTFNYLKLSISSFGINPKLFFKGFSGDLYVVLSFRVTYCHCHIGLLLAYLLFMDIISLNKLKKDYVQEHLLRTKGHACIYDIG